MMITTAVEFLKLLKGEHMVKKTGFDNAICVECVYNVDDRCTKCNSEIGSLYKCPEGYTCELMREIAEDINKRKNKLPHGNVFSREW